MDNIARWIPILLSITLMACQNNNNVDSHEEKKEAFYEILKKYHLNPADFNGGEITDQVITELDLTQMDSLLNQWAPVIHKFKPEREFIDHMLKIDQANYDKLNEEGVIPEVKDEIFNNIHEINTLLSQVEQQYPAPKSLYEYRSVEYYEKQLEIRSRPEFASMYDKEDLIKFTTLFMNVKQQIESQ